MKNKNWFNIGVIVVLVVGIVAFVIKLNIDEKVEAERIAEEKQHKEDLKKAKKEREEKEAKKEADIENGQPNVPIEEKDRRVVENRVTIRVPKLLRNDLTDDFIDQVRDIWLLDEDYAMFRGLDIREETESDKYNVKISMTLLEDNGELVNEQLIDEKSEDVISVISTSGEINDIEIEWSSPETTDEGDKHYPVGTFEYELDNGEYTRVYEQVDFDAWKDVD